MLRTVIDTSRGPINPACIVLPTENCQHIVGQGYRWVAVDHVLVTLHWVVHFEQDYRDINAQGEASASCGEEELKRG